MKNKICVITGGTAGLGKTTALALAKKQATIILASRNLEKGKRVAQEIQSQTGNSNIFPFFCDLGSQHSVVEFTDAFRSNYDNFDVLINNAGIYCAQLEQTEEGIEKTMGTNHIGHFLLTNRLLENLPEQAGRQIINLASAAHLRGRVDFLDSEKTTTYKGFQAYCDSKLANVLYTIELARRWKDRGVMVNSVHPGMVSTDIWPTHGWFALLTPILRRFILSVEEGAQTILHLATASLDPTQTGGYYAKSALTEPSHLAQRRDLQEKLWKWSEFNSLNRSGTMASLFS